VSASVTIKVKDLSKIGIITQQLADDPVGEGQSVDYTLENIGAANSKAVADAYHRAAISADTIAQLSGRSLGELSYASVDTFENDRPIPVARRMAANHQQNTTTPPTEDFTPGKVTVSAHVNAVFDLK
jgi:uncharacterized protein YggE